MEGLTWGGSGFGVRVSWSEYRRGQGRRSGPSQRKLGGSGLRQCIEIAEGGGFGGNVMEVLLLSPLLGFMVGFMCLEREKTRQKERENLHRGKEVEWRTG